MEFAGKRHSPVYADITWQVGIASHYPCLATANDWSVEVNDLGKSMDTGIGAASAVQPDRCAGDCAECLFELVLNGNRACVGL